MDPEKPSNVEPAAPADVGEDRSTEVSTARAQRRRFSASEKLRILTLADACPEGQIGALLRREGIYASSLSSWRAQRKQGSLAPRRRGPKPQLGASGRAEKKKLMRQNQQLLRRLQKAELIIEMQKKMASLLSSPLADNETDGSDL